MGLSLLTLGIKGLRRWITVSRNLGMDGQDFVAED